MGGGKEGAEGVSWNWTYAILEVIVTLFPPLFKRRFGDHNFRVPLINCISYFNATFGRQIGPFYTIVWDCKVSGA